MIMYHPNAELPINVHPSRIESMQNKGWTTEMPSQAKPNKAKSKAIETLEEIENGES
jgi:hypothetical protein